MKTASPRRILSVCLGQSLDLVHCAHDNGDADCSRRPSTLRLEPAFLRSLLAKLRAPSSSAGLGGPFGWRITLLPQLAPFPFPLPLVLVLVLFPLTGVPAPPRS